MKWSHINSGYFQIKISTNFLTKLATLHKLKLKKKFNMTRTCANNPIWKYFTKCEETAPGKGKNKAIPLASCNICHSRIKRNDGATSGLICHLR